MEQFKKNNFKLFLYESLDSHKAVVSVIMLSYLSQNLPSILFYGPVI